MPFLEGRARHLVGFGLSLLLHTFGGALFLTSMDEHGTSWREREQLAAWVVAAAREIVRLNELHARSALASEEQLLTAIALVQARSEQRRATRAFEAHVAEHRCGAA